MSKGATGASGSVVSGSSLFGEPETEHGSGFALDVQGSPVPHHADTPRIAHNHLHGLLRLPFTLLTGLVYPLAVTGMAQLIFPYQANGSLMQRDGKVIGSELIGQSFTDAKYFWGRPSATAPFAYNAAASSGSNLGPTNPALIDAVRARVKALRAADPQNPAPVPVDLVTASASGLDPHISVAAALYQLPR
ncbi:MAG: potassium-transporting ATPase subunit KdpC, partial [Syntrophobacteraceae bacterium]|nr:potassium-transporting ATPase subunit KdpC [Syntrophobacteraceae bacterium]